MKTPKLPLVGIICDREIIGPHSFHIVGDKYIQAILSESNCLPLLIPALAENKIIDQIINTLDGLLVTGGYSMVDPLQYQDTPASAEIKLDTYRDNTSLPIIKKAVEQGVPVLGICRGFQEMNVAFGGSLHQALHQHGQFFEHRENKDHSLEQQYAASHKVRLTPKGKLAKLLNETAIDVNSLHTQGVDRLADNLLIEAVSEDGLVEAVSVADAKSFALAVQWHPEWQVSLNENSCKIFKAFGEACLTKQLKK